MKLDTQFSKVEIMVEGQMGSLAYDELCEATEECVKIAENFAIGFAEWVDKIGLSPRDSVDYHLYLSHTITELLEIYKKTL